MSKEEKIVGQCKSSVSKEYLEAFKKLKQELYYSPNQIPDVDKWHETIEQALQRLEAIDNSNPSEALERFDYIGNDIIFAYDDDYVSYDYTDDVEYIKQALLKAQEQEKVLRIIKEKRVDIPYLYELFECIKQGKDTIESALKQYNDSVKNGINAYQLIEEEFNLLKEVL